MTISKDSLEHLQAFLNDFDMKDWNIYEALGWAELGRDGWLKKQKNAQFMRDMRTLGLRTYCLERAFSHWSCASETMRLKYLRGEPDEQTLDDLLDTELLDTAGLFDGADMSAFVAFEAQDQEGLHEPHEGTDVSGQDNTRELVLDDPQEDAA